MERQSGLKAHGPREHVIELLCTMCDELPKRHILRVTYVSNLGQAMDLRGVLRAPEVWEKHPELQTVQKIMLSTASTSIPPQLHTNHQGV